jgi:hypothetical protein
MQLSLVFEKRDDTGLLTDYRKFELDPQEGRRLLPTQKKELLLSALCSRQSLAARGALGRQRRHLP